MAGQGGWRAESPRQVPTELALLTGGGDRPYALGLAASLSDAGVALDFIGSDELECADLSARPGVRVLNLRGDMRPDAPHLHKAARVVRYYSRLIAYAAFAAPKTLHILWNNKFEYLDRTALIAFYKLLGKRVVITVHNVNIGKRDGNDTALNRWTLGIQYRFADHLFVHTQKMAEELRAEFDVPLAKISVIPFGINSTVPNTDLTPTAARARLGLGDAHKTLLFFGNIARYKGLEFLVEALPAVTEAWPEARLIVAGRPKGAEAYWAGIEQRICALGLGSRVVQRIEYVPDADTEIYFKAADLLVLPYTHVFQSGVLFLGYNFGTPVVATDVGSLREEIVEAATGFMCSATDATALATTILRFFDSDLYRDLPMRRAEIRRYAAERYSWEAVASICKAAYRSAKLS